jgi:HSP20 family protein
MNTLMKKNNGNLPAATFSGLVDTFFQNNLDRFFEDNFWGFGGLEHAHTIPTNVKETPTSYEVELVAPGLQKEDFKVNLDNKTLTVSVEQKEENNQQDNTGGWLRKEYKLRSFSRSFTIDDTIDVNSIKANYQNGILHLNLSKKEGARSISRTIEIE